MDFYLRDADGHQSGPHSLAYIQNKATTGGIAADHTFAAVVPPRQPDASDFKPATRGNLAAHINSVSRTAQEPDVPGGALRVGGILLAVLGVLGAAFGATIPGMGPYDDGSFSIAMFVGGAVQALVYGGLLWAAGTIIGQLDRIARTAAAGSN